MMDFLGSLYTALGIVAFALVPLGAWKLIEILAWVFQHVSVRWM